MQFVFRGGLVTVTDWEQRWDVTTFEVTNMDSPARQYDAAGECRLKIDGLMRPLNVSPQLLEVLCVCHDMIEENAQSGDDCDAILQTISQMIDARQAGEGA